MIMDNEAGSTVAALRDRRATIVAAMARYIARPSRGTPAPEHHEIAGALVDATFASFNGDATSAAVLPENLSRDFIVRFGDGLVPILTDIVGPDVTAGSLSRMNDAYWRAVDQAGAAAI